MTLPEFFQKLIDLVLAADITETFGGHLEMKRKNWLAQNLSILRDLSKTDPEHWPYQRSQNQSLWKSSVPYLTDAGVFAQFQGDAETRAKLKVFLGI